MSAIGPKQTWPPALHMSAFGGKADMCNRRKIAPAYVTGELHSAAYPMLTRCLPGEFQ